MEVLQLAKQYTMVQAESMRRDFRLFNKNAWKITEPGVPFVNGIHIDAICDHLTYVSLGDIDDLVINVPPRHSKSTTTAVSWPAWEWSWHPSTQWLFASYAQGLSIRDSIKCRRLINSHWYRERYADVYSLAGDLNKVMRFDTTANGYRLATSVGGSATGEGGDRIVVDDAHNMMEIESDKVREGVVSWWRNVMSTRGNNPKKLGRVIVAQRGHHMDLPGYAIGTGNWVHLKLPGYFRRNDRCVTRAKKDGPMRERDPKTGELTQPPAKNPRFAVPLKKDQEIWRDPRQLEDQLLTPERFGELEMIKMASELTDRGFEAQIQQNPSDKAGNILKKHHWRPWKEPEMPVCQMVIQSYDTAFEEEEVNDFTARTTWGVFEWEEHNDPDVLWKIKYPGQPRLGAILLERMEERLSFPDLREAAMQSYADWKPDRILIEKKASGHSLAQELKRAGLPVSRIKVSDSKHVRAHAASLVLERGCIWFPFGRKWAVDVIDHCAKFPAGEHDDITDTVTQMLLWLRRRWNAEYLDEDEDDIDLMRHLKKRKSIYG